MSGEHSRPCGAHGLTVGLMFSSVGFCLPRSWGFSLLVGVALLLSVGMSQGFLVRRLYE